MFYREEKLFNYTKMSNYHLKDKNLSLKAKGLFSIILSLPDNWQFSNEGLCSLCKEGKMAVDSAIKELKDNGYLKLIRKQNSLGKFYYDYEVYENPHTQLGHIDLPFTDK